MLGNERLFIDLLFSASRKYASWDPEIPVEVGDWGRISTGNRGWAFWRREQGIFIKEGNIYKDGTAEKYNIPQPNEFGANASEGATWIVSQNAEDFDVSGSVAGQTPSLAQCKIKAGYKFSASQGAVLVMDNDSVSTIDPPGALKRLLHADDMRETVIVSEVHRCSSYARLLTTKDGGSVVIGLSAEPPMSGVASGSVDLHWVRNSSSGNFRSKVNKDGTRTFYPLFRLVSLREKDISTGLREGLGDLNLSLPDVAPPWKVDETMKTKDLQEEHLGSQKTSGAAWTTAIRRRLSQGQKG